jgi:N-glycosylase/DNA lyase
MKAKKPTLSTATDLELREMKVPWPRTEKQLTTYINKLLKRKHDYGTCVYAMSMASLATMYYISHKLGVTGFQAGCADLDFIRRSRGYDQGFVISNLENILDPQYDLVKNLVEAIEKAKPQLAKKAKQLIIDSKGEAHPDLLKRWKEIADLG